MLKYTKCKVPNHHNPIFFTLKLYCSVKDLSKKNNEQIFTKFGVNILGTKLKRACTLRHNIFLKPFLTNLFVIELKIIVTELYLLENDKFDRGIDQFK